MTAARLASGLWLAAKLRRITAAGGFCTILHRGDETAGAVFVMLRHRDGTVSLAGPAPQTGQEGDGRTLEWRIRNGSQEAVDDTLSRERRFDRDLWCAEAECPDDLFNEVFGLA